MICAGHKESISFSQVEEIAIELATFLKTYRESFIAILLAYESYEVAEDEINRSIDLLENLVENRAFFMQKICSTFVFLPRNQPLYALFCFAIIPSLLSRNVFIKRPNAHSATFDELIKNLVSSNLLKNIQIFTNSRGAFLSMINATIHNSSCAGRAVIFTGTGKNAHDVSCQMQKRILFIANGSSHNPIVVSHDASIDKAVDAVLQVRLYNSGQDCAAPNSILVHSDVYIDFIQHLKDALRKVGIGSYKNIQNKIGSISNKNSIYLVQNMIACNNRWIDKDFPGSFLNKNTMEPLLISRPLIFGGGYSESYAPVFFVQEYTDDCDLQIYFEHELYIENAGYVSLFGSSDYVYKMASKKVGKRRISSVLHPKETILNNTSLHAPGVERGVKPYGGYGRNTSFVSFLGRKTYMPTLVQRDIFNFLIKPNI